MGGCVGHADSNIRNRQAATTTQQNIDRNDKKESNGVQNNHNKINQSRIPSGQPQMVSKISGSVLYESGNGKNEIILNIAETALDRNCPMMSSYLQKDETTFWKNAYNWYSLPIISPWNFKEPTIFSCKNMGIKFNHFIVGIIKGKDVKALTNTPWKTQGVLCYQSNAESKGSWILHGDKIKIPAKTVQPAYRLSIVTRKGKAQFWINKQFQGSVDIPPQFYMEICYPYVVAFCPQDSFIIVKNTPLKPYFPPE